MLRLQEHSHTAFTQALMVSLNRAGSYYAENRQEHADLLPELSDSAGQVSGVCQTVVGKTFLCVPGVITALPRQLLHTQKAAENEGY